MLTEKQKIQKMHKIVQGNIRDASILFVVVVAAVCTLGYFHQWNWAWLTLGLATLRAIANGSIGLVGAVSTIMLIMTGRQE
jgi:hypothetical protein